MCVRIQDKNKTQEIFQIFQSIHGTQFRNVPDCHPLSHFPFPIFKDQVKYDDKKSEHEKQIEFLDGACHPYPLSEVAIIKGTEDIAHPVHKEVRDEQDANRILRAMLGDNIFGRKWPNVANIGPNGPRWLAQIGPKN